MDEPDFLSSSRIAILGLGLMGGSLALALQGYCDRIWAYDPDPTVLELARQLKVVDRVSNQIEEILQDSNLVILAAPVGAILKLLQELPAMIPGPAVILDIGSTKREILKVMEKLPERFDPVGGHPMCGKEKLTLVNAEAAIFHGAPFILTPLERTSIQARRLVEQLAHAVGSYPLWLDPTTHDQWTAATSHLPYLIASALALATPVDAGILTGPGFRSTTRLAATPHSMMLDVLRTNKDFILEALQRFRGQMDIVEEQLIQSDFKGMEEFFSASLERKQDLGSMVSLKEQQGESGRNT